MAIFCVLVTWVVLSGLLSGASGLQRCVDGPLSDQCLCQQFQSGAFIISCNCNVTSQLHLSVENVYKLPVARMIKLHVGYCQKVVLGPDVLSDMQYLDELTFDSIDSLVLKSNSIYLDLIHENNFTLSIVSVADLQVEEDAITIQGSLREENITIKDTNITSLQHHAINASVSELLLENVKLDTFVSTNAILVGSSNASVSLVDVDAFEEGLTQKWITGVVSDLSLEGSNLTLFPNSFNGVEMSGSDHPKFTFKNNKIKLSREALGNVSVISLLAGTLNMDLPESGIEVDAKKNQIEQCECHNLTWTQTRHPRNSLLLKVQESLECTDSSISVAKCSASHFSSTLLLALISFSFCVAIVRLCFE